MNEELAELYAADQRERQEGRLSAENDRVRLARVRELLGAGVAAEPVDCFRAAMILHHGEALEHSEQACRLARQAFEGGYEQARKLVALTHDRWLTKQGKPQKYGTQYLGRDGVWQLMECDPNTTDAERSEWGVPPLAELLAMVDHLNQTRRK